MLNDLGWDEVIISKKRKREPELPEDTLIIFYRRNKLMEELMKRFDLEMEM